MPDYLYRGLEQMEIITVRAVCIKAFFTVMIFVFLRDETQYWLIPLLNIIGNGVAFFRCISASEAQNGHWLLSCYLTEVFSTLRDSLPFFYSRIATTVYKGPPPIPLCWNIISGTGAVTGYYTSADKLITTAKSGMSPISDSMNPTWSRTGIFG